MKINKSLLIDLVSGYDESEKFEVVQNQIDDTGRWSIYYDCTIKDKDTGKFYDASHRVGATEMQDEGPFENDETDEEVNLTLDEVFAYEEVVTKYRIKESGK